jgi:hypothetical protein
MAGVTEAGKLIELLQVFTLAGEFEGLGSYKGSSSTST